MPEKIDIYKTPDEIDTSDLKLEQGRCFRNALRVANKYPPVEIVEGIIVYVSLRNTAKIIRHVWNKMNGKHFDVTVDKIFYGTEEMKDSKEIKYVVVKMHNAKDFKDGDVFEFCEETNNTVSEMNDILNKN
ncbi:MAG: hypothetical protein WA440_03775 [Ignavibacteriaceae bacterium]